MLEFNPRGEKYVKIGKKSAFKYFWLAVFADGEEVAQYTDKGKEVLYREVLNRLEDGKGLSFIAFLPKDNTKDKPYYVQRIDSSWQRPIVFRRNTVKMNIPDGSTGRKQTIAFGLGWQATIGGKNYKSVVLIDPDTGSAVIDSNV